MKDKAASSTFVPVDDDASDEAEPASGSKLDTVLGNAFDAYEDGDRAGFIRSMKAALKLGE